MTRELLARGADPNIADKEGHTALHLAAGAGHLQVVTDLLRRRADPGIRDKVRCVCVQMCVCVDVCV
jgi:ankyrin repeat protein